MRLLLDLQQLCKHYGINTLTINQNDDDELVQIPLKKDIYIPLKCYVSYDTDNKRLYVSQRLICNGNYWLTQFKDDVNNGRIDPQAFITYGRPKTD